MSNSCLAGVKTTLDSIVKRFTCSRSRNIFKINENQEVDMSSCSWWNQSNLPCPATAAQKIDVSQKPNIKKSFESLLSDVSKCNETLKECLTLLDSEGLLFKRFLYKLNSVFIHDKGFKVLKQIKKSLVKLKQVDLQELITHFHEQHALTLSSHKFIHVAPRPVYEHLLIRTQGAARLLAQILCYCHAFGLTVLQKVQKGHFININIISMSFAARFWVLCLHFIHILINLHNLLIKVLEDEELLPVSIVKVLPVGLSIVPNLRDWLKNDLSLTNIQEILKPLETSKVVEKHNAVIWSSFTTKTNAERKHLEELKFLVETEGNVAQTELEKNLETTTSVCSNGVDLGVLVTREGSSLIDNKGKRRTRKRKRNSMKN